MRKVVFKERQKAKVKKRYDIVKTPLQRLLEKDVLKEEMKIVLLDQYHSLKPLALHRRIENLLAARPQGFTEDLAFEKELSTSFS